MRQSCRTDETGYSKLPVCVHTFLEHVVIVVCCFSLLSAVWSYAQPRLWSHDFSSHTPRSPVLIYVLEQRGSTITRARRLLLLPVESVYPPILRSSISSQHQHNTLTTSKYRADRQCVNKHKVLQLTGFEPTSVAMKAKSAASLTTGDN